LVGEKYRNELPETGPLFNTDKICKLNKAILTKLGIADVKAMMLSAGDLLNARESSTK